MKSFHYLIRNFKLIRISATLLTIPFIIFKNIDLVCKKNRFIRIININIEN